MYSDAEHRLLAVGPQNMCGMSDKIFIFWDDQHILTVAVYWACRSFTAYAWEINHWVKEIENKLAEVKQLCSKNEGDIRKVN